MVSIQLDQPTIQLELTIHPARATNQKVTWTSSNTAVATVSQTGLVTREGLGQCTITATTEDGGYTATCSIVVNPSSAKLFYDIMIPDNVANIMIDIGGYWDFISPWQIGDRNFLTLPKSNEATTILYDLDNIPQEANFVLDGTNPFYQWNLNFPGMKGVVVQHYYGFWQDIPGTHDDMYAFDAAATSIRVNKGMSYQIDGLGGVPTPHTINIPINQITIIGVSYACEIAIVQSNWVYNFAGATVGAPNVFNVFDNNRDYEIRVRGTGFTQFSIFGVRAGNTVDITR